LLRCSFFKRNDLLIGFTHCDSEIWAAQATPVGQNLVDRKSAELVYRTILNKEIDAPAPFHHRLAILPATGADGYFQTTRTRRLLHRGQRSRSASLAIGKSRPRVQTSVSMSSSLLNLHSGMLFMPSRVPNAQAIQTDTSLSSASPNVSICISVLYGQVIGTIELRA
jgi:hypothetical protein